MINHISSKKDVDDAIKTELDLLCCSASFNVPYSSTKPFKRNKRKYLNNPNQFERGLIIEDAVITEALFHNRNLSIHNLEGKTNYRNTKAININLLDKSFPKRYKNDLIEEIHRNEYTNSLDGKPLLSKNNLMEHFTSIHSCIAKTFIDYCCIDLIIDDNIIEVKSDVQSIKLKDYVKQVLLHSIQYNRYKSLEKIYHKDLSDEQIRLIKAGEKVNNVSVYFWRTNEFYKWKVSDLIPIDEFNKLVNLYTRNYHLCGTAIRRHIKNKIFT